MNKLFVTNTHAATLKHGNARAPSPMDAMGLHRYALPHPWGNTARPNLAGASGRAGARAPRASEPEIHVSSLRRCRHPPQRAHAVRREEAKHTRTHAARACVRCEDAKYIEEGV